MATLTGKTIAATYTSLLKLEGDSGSTAAGGSAAVQVKTGDDDDTPLYLNTNRIGIGSAAPVNILQVNHSAADNDNGIMIVNEATTIADGALLGAIGFDGADGNVPSSVLESSCFIAAYAAEDHSTGDKGGDLAFGCSVINENQDVVSTRHMTILDSGNVGIGTASPLTPLMIDNTTAFSLVSTQAGLDNIYLVNNTAGNGDDNYGASIGFGGASNDTNERRAAITSVQTGADSDVVGLAFCTHATTTGGDALTESMRIDGNGLVGIGTASPASDLNISSTSTTTLSIDSWNNDSAANSGYFDMRRSFHDSNYTAVRAADKLGAIRFWGSDGGGFSQTAEIRCVASGTINSGDVPGELQFYTTASGGTNATPTIRMTIDDGGNVGIGTAAPAYPLDLDLDGAQVNGNFYGLARFTIEDNTGAMVLGYDNSDKAVSIIGTNQSSGELAFWTHTGSAYQESVRIDKDGNVGIGTTSPSGNLHVQDSSIAGSDTTYYGILSQNSVTSHTGANGDYYGIFSTMEINSTSQDNDLCVAGAFFATSTDSADGSVALSATYSKTKMDAGDWDTVKGQDIFVDLNAGSVDSNVYGSYIDVDIESGMTAIAGNVYGQYILVDSAQDPVGKVYGLYIDGNTNIDYGLIVDGGNVGIGTATPDYDLEIEKTISSDGDECGILITGTGNSVTNQAKLGMNQDTNADTNAPCAFLMLDAADAESVYYFTGNNGLLFETTDRNLIGNVAGSDEIGDQTSDERLKNISSDPFPYGLTEINALSPIKYTFKKDKDKRSRIGFGAQTTQSIIPESVKVTEICIDGYERDYDSKGKKIGEHARSNDRSKMSMQYIQIIPVLVKAIQELSAKVTALENA